MRQVTRRALAMRSPRPSLVAVGLVALAATIGLSAGDRAASPETRAHANSIDAAMNAGMVMRIMVWFLVEMG